MQNFIVEVRVTLEVGDKFECDSEEPITLHLEEGNLLLMKNQATFAVYAPGNWQTVKITEKEVVV